MEGIGSRLGRASSRYGPAPVFSGPVRKWKRQWVHVSSSPSSSLSSYHNNNGNNNNASSALLLCRWTPINHSAAADSDKNSLNPDEPPRRKFRYTPIVVLEEKKKEVPEKAEDESSPSKTIQSMARETSETNDIFDKTDIDNLFNEDAQVTMLSLFTFHSLIPRTGSNNSQVGAEHSKRSQMDLDLRLKGHDDKSDSDSETEEAK